MHYLLAVHTIPGAALPNAEEMQEAFAAVEVFNALLKQNGAWVYAGGLQPIDTGEVVDATHEDVSVASDAAAGAGEHLGGFWVIRCDDRDAAVQWAAKASAACRNPVHVRPFQDDAE